MKLAPMGAALVGFANAGNGGRQCSEDSRCQTVGCGQIARTGRTLREPARLRRLAETAEALAWVGRRVTSRHR